MPNIKNSMWLTVIALSLICVLTVRVSYANERVLIGDGRVSFVPPAGFKAWTKEQISAKYAGGSPPQYVFADETGVVTVGVRFSPGKVAPQQLPEFKTALEQMLPRTIPGLKWVAREFVTINGRKWLHLEMTSHAIDTDIHNHMYATSFDGKALIFGFNSTIENYPKMKVSLLNSAQTITVRD